MIGNMAHMKDCLIVSNFAPHPESGCRSRNTNQNSQRNQTLTHIADFVTMASMDAQCNFSARSQRLESATSNTRCHPSKPKQGATIRLGRICLPEKHELVGLSGAGHEAISKCVCLSLSTDTSVQQCSHHDHVARCHGNVQGCAAAPVAHVQLFSCRCMFHKGFYAIPMRCPNLSGRTPFAACSRLRCARVARAPSCRSRSCTA